MAETICYMKLNRNVEITADDVFLKDLGSIRCADNLVAARIKSIKVCKFKQGNKAGERRCVMSILKIIALIEEACPGVTVENLGESEVVMERVKPNVHKCFSMVFKVILVSLICFFGTAFTIMAYHNDIGITDTFGQIYRVVMGHEPEGVNVLEVSYSIGLVLGIIVFFNHVGGRRLTKDPTPIEVEMRKYECDVNATLVENANREGRIIDVE